MTYPLSRRPAYASFVVLVSAMGLIAGELMGSAAVAAPSTEISPQASVSSNGSWSSIGGSPDSAVMALAADTSGSLYVGGEFTSIDGQPLLRIARWGQLTAGGDDTWSALGAGLDDDVRTLAWDDTLYIGGEFSGEVGGISLSRMAAWARQGGDDTYVSLASGIDPQAGNNSANPSVVFSILPTDDTVYVGGDFASASSVPDTRQMAGWVDDTWASIGGGIPNCATAIAERVLSFAELPGQGLVVGGKFRCAGTSTPEDDTNIAIWDGAAWSPMNGGVRPPLATAGEIVTSLIPHDGLLYVGGEFNEAGPPGSAITVGSLAIWDGTAWAGIGDGLAGACGAATDFPEVYSMQLDSARGLLYAAGAFCRAGDDTVNSIVVRDLGVDEWVPLVAPGSNVGLTAADPSEIVRALLLDDSTLLVGGKFAAAGGVGGPDNLARWTWEPPAGTNAVVASPGETVSITGSRFIGVPDSGGVFIGGVPVSSYTRVSTGQITGVVVPNGVSGTATIEVDAVGGRGVVGTLTVPPPRPAGPPGAVSAVGGDQSALVSWDAPSSSGSFPVTNYQVVGSPSGSCLVPAATLSCEVSGLRNGVEYSFRVRALTGAGWGAWSESVTVVPEPPAPEQTIVITGSREGSSVVVKGATTGLVGEQVTPWIRFPGPYSYEAGTGARTVGEDGTFTWQRKTRKKIYVYFRAEDDVRSNRVIIRP